MRAEFSTNVVQGTGSTGVAPRLAKPYGDTQPSVKNSRGLECNYGFCHSGGQSSARVSRSDLEGGRLGQLAAPVPQEF